MNSLIDRYLAEHVAVQNAAKTQREAKRNTDLHIRPAIGTLPVEGVTRQDIIKLHNSMAKTPRQANIIVRTLSKIFSLAELWELREEGSNPCRKVVLYPENERERFLSVDELQRLGATLAEVETNGLPWDIDPDLPESKHLPKEENRRTFIDPAITTIIKLLLFTGARLSEIRELRWEQIDFERETIALPSRKGGKLQPHPVNAEAIGYLKNVVKIPACPWVFPRQKDPSRPLAIEVMENAWRRIRLRAGIPDVRLHDLRHTVGTYASQSGANAFVVRDVLRHKTIAMTGRYSNFDANPVRQVSHIVGQRIAAGLAGKKAPTQ